MTGKGSLIIGENKAAFCRERHNYINHLRRVGRNNGGEERKSSFTQGYKSEGAAGVCLARWPQSTISLTPNFFSRHPQLAILKEGGGGREREKSFTLLLAGGGGEKVSDPQFSHFVALPPPVPLPVINNWSLIGAWHLLKNSI